MARARKGDPNNSPLHRIVPLGDRVKHLLKFGEKKNMPNGSTVFPPALDLPTRLWTKGSVFCNKQAFFLKQNSGEAYLASDELHKVVTNNVTGVFISKMSRYLSNVTGCSAYCHKAKEDLKATIKGPCWTSNILLHIFVCRRALAWITWPL